MIGSLFNRRVIGSAILVAALLAVALWPETIPVDVVSVSRGSLIVTVDEEGQTRVRDRFVVSTPVAGRVLRVDLEPGDPVRRGDIVARVRPEAPSLLDERTRLEMLAAVESARATLGRSRAEEQRARATLAVADRELARVRALAADELATRQEVDARQGDVDVATEALNAAIFAVRAAESELQRAQARLAPTSLETGGVISVQAPVDGVVLRRLRESESVVPAGDPLLEIGDPNDLEVVADLLSTDAVRVKTGAPAMIEQWGGDRVLKAKVRLVEPSGFTKISALGVEEQRVNVILDFTDPVDAWSVLGDGYRVEVRVVIWQGSDLLKIPTGALFREGADWAAYVVESGRAQLTVVQIGQQSGQEAEVVSGLSEGDQVILHPGDTLVTGSRVDVRGL